MHIWDLLMSFIITQKVAAVQPIIPTACIVYTVDPLPTYDFDTDSSIHKFVSPFSSLQQETYVPSNLVRLQQVGKGVIDIKNNDGKLRAEAADALVEMGKVFYAQFGKPLVIVSSYRGYEYQKKLLAGYTEKHGAGRAGVFSAKPGHSEHQLGLAIDVFNTSADGEVGYKDYFAWLRTNAHKYGWTQSYQKGVAIDGYIVEPWHWRYVGQELATYLWENKMTFSEYVRFWWVWRAGK